jgi:hypothetical protein
VDECRDRLRVFATAPDWFSVTSDQKRTALPGASLVIIRLPGEKHWTVATRLEVWHVGNN